MTFEPTKPRGPIAAQYSSPGPCYALPTLMGSVAHDCRSTQVKAPAFQFGLRYVRMYSPSLLSGFYSSSMIILACRKRWKPAIFDVCGEYSNGA